MALSNGLLIHGRLTGRLRARHGREVEVASSAKPELAPKLAGACRAAGAAEAVEAMAVLPLVRTALPRPVAVRGLAVAAAIADPGRDRALRRRWRARRCARGSCRRWARAGVVALLDRDLAAYHGVEHKAIAAYEQGIEDPASVPKEHDRCGSNLIAPMMLLSAGGTVLLERLVERPARGARRVGLGGASLAVEMFAWSDRHHGAPLAEAFHTPGARSSADSRPRSRRRAARGRDRGAGRDPPRRGPRRRGRAAPPRRPSLDCRRCSARSTTSASPSRTSTRRSSSTQEPSR
jgi:hypothetical protein